MPETAPSSSTTVRPALAPPLGLVGFALFVGLIGSVALGVLGLRDGWWIGVPALLLAAMAAVAALRTFTLRSTLVLVVRDDGFAVGDLDVRRFQVTAVRRYKALLFDGVRIDRGPDLWLGIPNSVHAPTKLLAVFRKHGYPVADSS